MSICVAWRPRSAPLEPVGAVASGDTARARGRRVTAADDTALARLRGVTAGPWLVLLGDAADLPWVDGVIYVGRDARAPALLLPTVFEPTVPVAVFARALARRHGDARPPLVVLPEPACVLPCAAARQVSRARLQAWLDGTS